MALLDYEGFNKESNSQLSNWFSIAGSFGISADGVGPFNYGRCAQSAYGNGRNFTPTQTLWMQGHVRQGAAGNGDRVWSLSDSGTIQVSWTFENDLRVTIKYHGGQVTSALPVAALNAWYFVQFRVRIADSGGTAELFFNGVSVLSYTGDTKVTANAYANQWVLWNNSNNTWHANILIYDETGAAPNAKTPETRIYGDLPTGAGATTEWTPSAGANWQNVDEQPNDGDTTYNSVAAAVASDLYGYPASTVPSGAIVYAVAAEYDVRKDDGGTNEVDALVRSGGTTYAASDVKTLTSTWQRFRSIWATDPATAAAWTPANANAAQLGIRRTT